MLLSCARWTQPEVLPGQYQVVWFYVAINKFHGLLVQRPAAAFPFRNVVWIWATPIHVATRLKVEAVVDVEV